MFRQAGGVDTTIEMRSLLNTPETVSRTGSSGQEDRANRIMESRRQIIKMILVIILVFTTCWSPRFIINIIRRISELLGLKISTLAMYYSTQVAWHLSSVNVMLNPIIYM